MTPQRLNQNTATPQKCRNVQRSAPEQSFATRSAWRNSETDLGFVCVDLVSLGAAPFVSKGAVFDFSYDSFSALLPDLLSAISLSEMI
jgi:hypothetical protein